jgi:hypothetical protein
MAMVPLPWTTRRWTSPFLTILAPSEHYDEGILQAKLLPNRGPIHQRAADVRQSFPRLKSPSLQAPLCRRRGGPTSIEAVNQTASIMRHSAVSGR